MKRLFQITIISLLISCQIEDDNSPKPIDSFIKYYGELANQEAKDIEPIYADDGVTLEGFVVFGTQQLEDSTADYFVMTTDPTGNIINSNSFGFKNSLNRDFDNDGENEVLASDESAGQIEVLASGGFLTIGTSTINNSLLGINDFKFITMAFLDENLDTLALLPFGDFDTQNDYEGHDIIQLSDGTIFIVGSAESSGNTEYYYARFSLDSIYYQRTNGFGTGDDEMVRAFEQADGNIAMFGTSEDRGVEGEAGSNVTFVEVNPNGNILNSNSNGILEPVGTALIYDEELSDVVEIPGGYAAVGTSFFSNNQNFGFFMSLNNDGIANFKDTLTSEFSQDGTSTNQLQTRATGITSTITNDFVIVGQYPNFRTQTETRGAEAMFFRVDQVGDKIPGQEANYGIGGGNDNATDVITLVDGKIVMATTIDFGGGVKMISIIKLNDTGQLDN